MKNAIHCLVLLALGCTLFGTLDCALTQKVTTPVIATVKDCADQVTHSVTAGILDDVSAVLVCDGGNAAALPPCVVAELGVIAAKSGWSAIDCALIEIQNKASANAAASEDTLENLRARRAVAARDWRALQAAAAADGGAQ